MKALLVARQVQAQATVAGTLAGGTCSTQPQKSGPPVLGQAQLEASTASGLAVEGCYFS